MFWLSFSSLKSHAVAEPTEIDHPNGGNPRWYHIFIFLGLSFVVLALVLVFCGAVALSCLLASVVLSFGLDLGLGPVAVLSRLVLSCLMFSFLVLSCLHLSSLTLVYTSSVVFYIICLGLGLVVLSWL